MASKLHGATIIGSTTDIDMSNGAISSSGALSLSSTSAATTITSGGATTITSDGYISIVAPTNGIAINADGGDLTLVASGGSGNDIILSSDSEVAVRAALVQYGNSGTLTIDDGYIKSTGTPGVMVGSTGNNDHTAMTIYGAAGGTHWGLEVVGPTGTAGGALRAVSSGSGVGGEFYGVNNHGVYSVSLSGTNFHGGKFISSGSANTYGVYGESASSSGAGVYGTATNSGFGGIFVGHSTGDGISATGGASGDGATISAGATDGYGARITGTGSGAGVHALASGTGYGLIVEAIGNTPIRTALRLVPQMTDPSSVEVGDMYIRNHSGLISNRVAGPIWGRVVTKVRSITSAITTSVGSDSNAIIAIHPIASSSLQAGSTIRVYCSGTSTNPVGLPTVGFNIAGTDDAVFSAQLTNATNRFAIEGKFTMRTVGASGTIWGMSSYDTLSLSTYARRFSSYGYSTVNTTNGVDIAIKCYAAEGGADMRVDEFIVDISD